MERKANQTEATIFFYVDIYATIFLTLTYMQPRLAFTGVLSLSQILTNCEALDDDEVKES